MKLFHYTCSHSKRHIQQDMMLYAPNVAFAGLIWLTDLEKPDAEGLGLTMHMLRCDRTEWRCTVETDTAVPWTKWAHENKVGTHIRLALDGAEGARPLHWWVSREMQQVLAIESTK